MKRHLAIIITFVASLCPSPAGAQSQSNDTLRQSMPKLEIPEITIIGKKAITLPFARKGEIFDVDIYKAPPPDSSLVGRNPLLPLGLLPLP